MPIIYSSQTPNLFVQVSRGIEAISNCVYWTGFTGQEGGTTGPLTISAGSTPAAGTPFIRTADSCTGSPGGDGSLTGTLYPNGYTGYLSAAVVITDAVGVTASSDYTEFQIISATAPIGPTGSNPTFDIRITSGSFAPTGTQARIGLTASFYLGQSGVAPYTWLWQKVTGTGGTSFSNPTGSATYFTVTWPGNYTIRLNGTDSVGQVDFIQNVYTYSAGTIEVNNQKPGYSSDTITDVKFNTTSLGTIGLTPNFYLNPGEVGVCTNLIAAGNYQIYVDVTYDLSSTPGKIRLFKDGLLTATITNPINGQNVFPSTYSNLSSTSWEIIWSTS